jgi:hypothetical protein
MIPQHSSASNEHPTPPDIVRRARALMGGRIDLDPASTPEFNQQIGATDIYTIVNDGLSCRWWGNVFLNPPGGKLKRAGNRWVPVKGGKSESSMRVWWDHLVREWLSHRVEQAFFVGFTLEILRTSQSCVLPVQAFPRCYPKERLAFKGDDPTHANVLVWLPALGGPGELHRQWFDTHFGAIGLCEAGMSDTVTR